MNRIKQVCGGFLLAGALIGLQSPGLAVAQDEDPPGRVARMNFTQGSVSFQPEGENDWVAAVPNRPLTTGDSLYTDQNSRAEMHIGSTAIRLDAQTEVTFLRLDDAAVQLRVSQGSVIVRVNHLDDNDMLEVDTPNLAFQVQSVGEYRVDVNEAGDETVATVWRGRGEVTGGGYSYTVVAGQQARFSGSDALNYDIGQIPRAGDFERWAFDRDRREEGAESANYVSREMTGYEDLDDYGRWNYVASYGPVWVPERVPAGWAPYRFGHWVFIDPWGWTWVDDAPWGFAPFHYGRWAYLGAGWCWVPGPVVTRPVYAPAMVAFVGGTPGFHFSISFGGGGGVAWFPLGPGEVFAPAYRVSPRYVTNVNVTNTYVNVTKVTNVYNYYNTNDVANLSRITYANRRAPNGMTAVPRDTFENARPVARGAVKIPDKDVADAPVTHGAPGEPTRASVYGAGRPAAQPPARITGRQVVAKSPPPSVPRNPREYREGPPEPAAGSNRAPEAGHAPPGHAAPPHAAPPNAPPPQGAPPQAPPSHGAPSRTAPPSRDQAGQQPPSQAERRPNTLARPAPPVREKSEQQMRQDEAKFHAWQAEHQKKAPPASPPPKPPDKGKPAPKKPD
jgi:hypothetical protein